MSRIRLLSVSAILLALAGCVPGVAWLPDSRGFYYTAGKDYQQLCFFDLKTKKHKVLVEDTKTNSGWPAISPDGKQLALAFEKTEKADKGGNSKPSTLQIAFFDKDGKEQKRTKEFPWAKGGGPPGGLIGPNQPGAQVYWSPKGDKLLVFSGDATGLYDQKTDQLTKFANTALLVYGNSPFQPDGKGFLAVKVPDDPTGKQEPPRIALIDFDGKETLLPAPEEFGKKDVVGLEKGMSKLMVYFGPAVVDSSWTQDGARAAWGEEILKINLAKKTVAFEAAKKQMTDDGRPIIRSFTFKDGGATLRLVELPMGKDDQGFGPPMRLEVLVGGKAKVLRENSPMCLIQPSPDSRTAVLIAPDSQKSKTEKLLVVNSQGEVLADLEGKN